MYGPTGQGQTVNGADVAGTEPAALPSRPARAAANDAARVAGICNASDRAADGAVDMKGSEPWR